MFVHYTFSSVWVAEWPPFGKKLPAWLAICSHCILSICNIYLFPVLVLRAGFAFLLLQFLFIAFLLLLWSMVSDLIIFIDHYHAGVSDKHLLIAIFHLNLVMKISMRFVFFP